MTAHLVLAAGLVVRALHQAASPQRHHPLHPRPPAHHLPLHPTVLSAASHYLSNPAGTLPSPCPGPGPGLPALPPHQHLPSRGELRVGALVKLHKDGQPGRVAVTKSNLGNLKLVKVAFFNLALVFTNKSIISNLPFWHLYKLGLCTCVPQ